MVFQGNSSVSSNLAGVLFLIHNISPLSFIQLFPPCATLGCCMDSEISACGVPDTKQLRGAQHVGDI